MCALAGMTEAPPMLCCRCLCCCCCLLLLLLLPRLLLLLLSAACLPPLQVGDPEFALVDEAYPYIAKRLLTDPSPRLQVCSSFFQLFTKKIVGAESCTVFDCTCCVGIWDSVTCSGRRWLTHPLACLVAWRRLCSAPMLAACVCCRRTARLPCGTWCTARPASLTQID